ncbi:MAG: tetratricopeptide repeat protein [Proteobacteria bacterium]|nr:tetratricopeptide repeat protein [Pseudomonadota bacterium]MBU1546872.1 tetratricopeptide repeat protein [Pseudomonadota bacterium]MBU2618886.1 tetratricopeptide repeat protein [Pseudomonadota bacterium]
MASQPEQSSAGGYKTEIVLVIGLCCLIIGFLSGIVFSIYKSPASEGGATVATGQPEAQAGKLTAEQAQHLLHLELEVQKNPQNIEAWTSLGNLYFDSDQADKAINAYSKSLALAPNNADVLTDLGVMYRRVGNPQQAIASFDRAIQVNAKHETARFNKGVVLLYDLKDHSGTIDAWQELISLNPMATAPNGQLVSEILNEIQDKKMD